MIRKKDLLDRLNKLEKDQFNFRIDVSTAIAHVSNQCDVNDMSNETMLKAIFDALVKDGK